MAKTTGVVLAVGAIAFANQVIVNKQPVDWRIPIATALSAGMFTLAEKVWEDGAVALSYLALVTILFVRIDPRTPSPVEGFNKLING